MAVFGSQGKRASLRSGSHFIVVSSTTTSYIPPYCTIPPVTVAKIFSFCLIDRKEIFVVGIPQQMLGYFSPLLSIYCLQIVI